jgi:hypothetical protein
MVASASDARMMLIALVSGERGSHTSTTWVVSAMCDSSLRGHADGYEQAL